MILDKFMPKNNNLNIETDMFHWSSSNAQRTSLISEVEGTHYTDCLTLKRESGLNYWVSFVTTLVSKCIYTFYIFHINCGKGLDSPLNIMYTFLLFI